MKPASIQKVSVREHIDVRIGQADIPVGQLTYVRQGQRENTTFAYSERWLADVERFQISPDLELVTGYQPRRAPSRHDSAFHFAFADTEPDAWGRRVIAREHAKRRKDTPHAVALTELDYLLAVDDFSRVGALRLRDANGHYQRTVEEGKRTTPPLIELQRMFDASRAVEKGRETAEDLKYLQGKGTSLGGMRPKCTVIDENGMLAIGKFPSINDSRSVTRGEVLALRLARRAGIEAATARVVEIDKIPVALIQRFDRTLDSGRIPYLSAASMLQASREDEHSYVEIVDAIRARGSRPTDDAQQLWRRIAFNHLITNIDDHLQNHGFLHTGRGLWKLAPAFDVNPFPDKDQESKTWLSEQDGPITDIKVLVARCDRFGLTTQQGLAALADIYQAVSDWRGVALSAEVRISAKELDDFAPAFEHAQLEATRQLLRA